MQPALRALERLGKKTCFQFAYKMFKSVFSRQFVHLFGDDYDDQFNSVQLGNL